ncbi:MAG: hypothetical protein H7Y38_06980, partial [Armatimonadetes bacterium]|nr:hypothetical protein [Armatimonadota bacterium]
NAPYTPPPLPVLGGAYAGGAGLQQAWTTDRHTFEMKVKAGRQSWKDAISEYRTGSLTVGVEGITIVGKAVLPNAIRTTIFVVSALLVRFLLIIAYVVFEYAVRRDRADTFSWNEIDAVLVESPKNRVCIVYHFADKPKNKVALGLVMEGGSLDAFLRSVRAVAPERVLEGKVGAETNIWVLLLIVVVIVGAVFLAMLNASPRP